MQITEVKNNLVKIVYNASEENLVLAGFVVIKDVLQSFIAQVIHLEATPKGNYAIAKLFFTFNDDGVITAYNGAIPNPKCLMDVVHPLELLELFPIQIPIILGELAQQKTLLKLDKNIFEKKLLVCCEKEEDTKTLTQNFAQQLVSAGKKVLVIDASGNLAIEKVTAGKDFKLPLNYETINFIYEKGLEDAKAETKAMIQEIFLEVQEYVKTLPENFIPFDTFKNVVDSQYEELELVELVLLKNKLLKYYEAGIFAQSKEEFETLEESLRNNYLCVFDISETEEIIQREMISYAYSLIEQLDEEIYVIVNINDSNSDKKLLKQIYTAKNVYNTIICPYAYKNLKELKQISKDLILFAPIQQQDDFASYSVFLNKLNAHEFVVYGQATHHLPLIVKLDELSKYTEQEIPVTEEVSQQDLLDEEISKDLDKIYTTPKSEQEPENLAQEELTEEDLDIIDDIGVINEQIELDEISNIGQPVNDIIDESIEEASADFIEEETNQILPEKPEQPLDFSAIQSEEEEEKTFQPFDSSTIQPIEETPVVDILPANMAATPIVPIYSADIEPQAQSSDIEQGDIVMHPKYGKGTVEKLISYGSKTLCSINFDNVGRRLLDPSLAEIKKI